jgi:hypothetical protein
MPRAPSETLKFLENLPRRAVLKGAVASPLALAIAAGQVSAGSLDPRLAEVDALIREIDRTEEIQYVASQTQGAENDDGENVFEIENAKWYAAREALESYGLALAEQPSRTFGDALVLARIADFWLVTDADHLSDLDLGDYPTVRGAITAHLEAAGVPLYKLPKHRRQENERLAKAIAARPVERTKPWGVNAGNLIAQVQKLGKAYDAAIRREASIPDGTFKSRKAIAVTNQRLTELVALRDEIIAGTNKPFDARSRDDTYNLNQTELLAVWVALIEALRPAFFEHEVDDDVLPVLAEMRRAGALWAGTCLEQARRWNAGGANV